ncbi:MAG TPA: sulfate ABC transporter permease subunit CysW [Myxococcales bacterium]|nr:sulfate ABC transporter permease subunit CysW [Myxococcales bacterium]
MRWLLVGVAFTFVALLVVAPLAAVFAQAFGHGLAAYWRAVQSADTLGAIELTLLIAVIAVPLNLAFGLAASWLIAKYDFPGRSVLLSLIDLPFSVSPVIAGLLFVLLFGSQGLLGGFVARHGLHVIFALPGMVLATTFVTFPLVAREVLPLMQSLGSEEEEAALTLGASGPRLFFRVTLPKIRWGLVNGVILCNARAMGEFGAVTVVSGLIRGKTITMPLQIEILYNDYDFVGAFAVATLLTLLALVTLAVKRIVEGRQPGAS